MNLYKKFYNNRLILDAKVFSFMIKTFRLGNGSTWPGHYVLKFSPQFIRHVLSINKLKTIIVAGTNGKTTTSGMIKTILERNGKTVIQNDSGANLVNGIASTLALHSDLSGKISQDYAIFEVDENALPRVLEQVQPDYLVLLNLFRDQLDRYGEVNVIADKWEHAIEQLEDRTVLIANADDPEIAYLGTKRENSIYFGLDEKQQITTDHASDSIYCPQCGNKLHFTKRFFSHLGIWECRKCHLERPQVAITHLKTYPLVGTYNKYNSLAAALLGKSIQLDDTQIIEALNTFQPAFGRQETITYDGKNITLFLAKNPTGFNESLRTIAALGAKYILIVLNDRIPDGRDVSWIWDVDFEELVSNEQQIFVSGYRAYDMSLRLKYALSDKKLTTYPDLKNEGLLKTLKQVPQDETLFILPTYSAMLEIREILTGRKIL